MKNVLFLLLVFFSGTVSSQDNTITVYGAASRRIEPVKMTVVVNLNDEYCSPELPTIEAVTAKYISVTKSLGVLAADNILKKQRVQQTEVRNYNYLTYQLTLKSEDELDVLFTSLGIDTEYNYSGSATYTASVSEREYPNLEQVYSDLRKDAFKNAQTAAQDLAKLSGKKLGSVVSMAELGDFASYDARTVRVESLDEVYYKIEVKYSLLP